MRTEEEKQFVERQDNKCEIKGDGGSSAVCVNVIMFFFFFLPWLSAKPSHQAAGTWVGEEGERRRRGGGGVSYETGITGMP